MRLNTRLCTILAIITLIACLAPSHAADPIGESFRRAHGAMIDKDFRRAEKNFRTILNQQPQSSRAHYGLVKVLLEQNKITAARNHALHLIEIHPESPDGYYLLGTVHEQDGDTDSAIDQYKKYLVKTGGKLPPDPRIRLKFRQLGLY